MSKILTDDIKELKVLDKNDNVVVSIDNTGVDEPIKTTGGNECYYKVKIKYGDGWVK
jgi:hypothetical protein